MPLVELWMCLGWCSHNFCRVYCAYTPFSVTHLNEKWTGTQNQNYICCYCKFTFRINSICPPVGGWMQEFAMHCTALQCTSSGGPVKSTRYADFTRSPDLRRSMGWVWDWSGMVIFPHPFPRPIDRHYPINYTVQLFMIITTSSNTKHLESGKELA